LAVTIKILIAFILIGGPVIGIGYLMISYPGHDETTGRSLETRATIFLKIILSLLLIWILTVMRANIGALGAAL